MVIRVSAKSHSIRNRVIACYVGLALLVAVLFSFLNLLFIYSIEDTFFEHLLQEEAQHQLNHWDQYGTTTSPLRPNIALYTSSGQLPADMRQQFMEKPRRREFYGAEGRHYHLLTLQVAQDEPPYYLLAEVSEQLVVRPMRDRMLLSYALFGGAMLLLACLLGYWLAQRSLHPLTRLVALINRARPGQLPRNFAASFPENEIGMLATTLDDALQRLSEFIEREQNFSRDASHELRTPVSVIRSAAELLDTQPLPVQARGQLQRIRQANLQMEQTVNLLLSLAREVLPQEKTVETALLPLLERVIVQQAYLLRDREIELRIDVPVDAVVAVPGAALTILLGNLLSNAFIHSREGTIIIRYRAPQLSIADSGPGIDPEIQSVLFQPLVKGQHSAGHGLGLSIVKRLCDRYGIGLDINSGDNGIRILLQLPPDADAVSGE